MKKMLNTIWVMGVLTLAVFCLSACDRDLDIQQSYPFTVETMPVQKDIIRGQTAEIRCTLKRGGDFADTRYTIRYFQSDGKGQHTHYPNRIQYLFHLFFYLKVKL